MTVLYLGYCIYIDNIRLKCIEQSDFMLIYYFYEGLCVSDIRTFDRDFRWILDDLDRCNPNLRYKNARCWYNRNFTVESRLSQVN